MAGAVPVEHMKTLYIYNQLVNVLFYCMLQVLFLLNSSEVRSRRLKGRMHIGTDVVNVMLCATKVQVIVIYRDIHKYVVHIYIYIYVDRMTAVCCSHHVSLFGVLCPRCWNRFSSIGVLRSIFLRSCIDLLLSSLCLL